MFFNNQDKQEPNLPQELASSLSNERTKSYKVYPYTFTDTSLPAAGDAVSVSGFQVSPPFTNSKNVSFKNVSFFVIATDATTGTNYDVTSQSSLQLLQFDMSAFVPLGTAVGNSNVYISGGQQNVQFQAGEFVLTGAAINVQITTPNGSKGFVAAANWSITVYVTLEFWYGN